MHNLLIVDDEEEIIHLLGPHFEKDGFNLYSATASDQAIRIATNNDIDIMLCDMVIPHEPGKHPLHLSRSYKQVPVLVAMTGYDDVKAEDAYSHDVHAFIRKPIAISDLVATVKRLLNLFPPQKNISLQLTEREVEILKHVAEGLTSKEIAATCFISPRTVEKHKQNIMSRIGAKNSAELVAKAARLLPTL